MLKPITLFGVEQKRSQVYFINEKGTGFWFLSTGHRIFGEAKSLKELSENAQKMELARNWIILDIVRENRDALFNEYKETNPDELSNEEFDTLSEAEINNKLGIYTRQLIKDTDLFHPILWNYKERVSESLFTTDLTFEYQETIVKCAIKYRLITNVSYITLDPDDPERGTVETLDTVGQDFIGYKFPNIDLTELGEPLCLKIYDFCQKEFRSEPWQTSKQLETQAQEIDNKITEEIGEDTEISEKKENLPLIPYGE